MKSGDPEIAQNDRRVTKNEKQERGVKNREILAMLPIL